eukprot:Skav227230  [mRNA]  locus=scaffold2789:5092:9256:- [translate_table: standard]
MSNWLSFGQEQPRSSAQGGSETSQSGNNWNPFSASRGTSAGGGSLRNLAGQLGEAQEAATQSDSLCPSLTLRQRIIGWLSCLGLGIILEITGVGRGLHALLGGEKGAERFASLYTVGNLLALVGTFFLAGPARQCRRMGDQKRWVASACFVLSMLLTFVVCLSQGNWHGRTLVLLLLVFIQWTALVWYTLSYIPFGQQSALAALRGCWSRCFGG